MAESDFSQRFLFDETDVRGEWVTLQHSYTDVLAKHRYPEPVAQLLGELMAAAALLVGTLKFDGILVLQARSEGPLSLLMVECSSQRELRGIARYEAHQCQPDARLGDLMPQGVLAITIDPRQGQRYQGVVALEGETLGDCLSDYFATSEQLPTRFWLCADGQRATGLLLQQLPVDRITDPETREAHWQHLSTLAETLTAEEQLSLDAHTLLHRLFHQEVLRLFEPEPVCFHCSCSRERSAHALQSIGQADAEAVLLEQGGQVVIDCQFCNQRYVFDSADVAQLFVGAGTQGPDGTRH